MPWEHGSGGCAIGPLGEGTEYPCDDQYYEIDGDRVASFHTTIEQHDTMPDVVEQLEGLLALPGVSPQWSYLGEIQAYAFAGTAGDPIMWIERRHLKPGATWDPEPHKGTYQGSETKDTLLALEDRASGLVWRTLPCDAIILVPFDATRFTFDAIRAERSEP
jgi:hypothetical protein